MRARGFAAILAFALGVLFLTPGASHAWKPYTHNYSGDLARGDVLDDGMITIDGRAYPVRPEVFAALRDWPQYYDAGVIGPDGFPDLTYGQAVIHPVDTGEWLRHLHQQAWLAQVNPTYSDAEKSQILAFTYGFLTHAAGDMWGHTLINDFADPSHTEGVFPAVSEILTSVEKAGIAVRHIIAEGYVGDATPGYDANPDRGPAPNGDVSDDSTPGRAYAVPGRFLYETLISTSAATPVPAVRGSYSDARGPIIGFFLELHDDLEDFIAYDPDPLQDAIDAFDDTVEDLMALECACNFGSDAATNCSNACCLGDCGDWCDIASDLIDCPASLIVLGFDIVIDSFEAFLAFTAGVTEELALVVVDAYLAAWVDDIDAGLRDWNNLGLASTRALFDPQTRRDLQNDECQFKGDENTLLRAQCEDGVGALDVVFHEVDPFINDHLLSMIGLPDLVGDVREIVQVVLDFFEDILGVLGMPFNPLFEALAQLEEWIKDLLVDAIAEVIGIDIEQLGEFLKEPHRFICLDETAISLPPPIGDVTLPLYPAGSHDRLDGIIGLDPGHHVPALGLPDDCGRLGDDVAFDPNQFKPMKNTVTMAKLLLLDGTRMNQMLTDVLGREISTYAAADDVMFKSLAGDAWLRMIDGDHAWRADGSPVFPARPEAITGGSGQFPIWESCVARRAMRTLFSDWENGPENFPDLNDPVSADPVNDPQPPTSALGRTGAFYDDGTHQYIAADNEFTHTAADGPANKAFTAAELELQHRFYPTPGPQSAWTTTGQPAVFSLTGADGLYTLDIRSGDPCHTCDDTDALPAETPQSREFVLDTTPPVVTCENPPFGLSFDTDDLSSVQYSISDGPLGSGVASQSAILDGYLTESGTIAVSDGSVLDMYLLYPGVRTVTVTSADNLGNSGETSCTFEIHPTAASMLNNLDRAYAEGEIKNQGLYNSLKAKLNAANAAGARSQCDTEYNILRAFIHEMQAQRGTGVDAVIADRFIAYALDIINHGDPRCASGMDGNRTEEVAR